MKHNWANQLLFSFVSYFYEQFTCLTSMNGYCIFLLKLLEFNWYYAFRDRDREREKKKTNENPIIFFPLSIHLRSMPLKYNIKILRNAKQSPHLQA